MCVYVFVHPCHPAMCVVSIQLLSPTLSLSLSFLPLKIYKVSFFTL